MSIDSAMQALKNNNGSNLPLGSSIDRAMASLRANADRNVAPEFANTLEAGGFDMFGIEMFPDRPDEFSTSLEPRNRREKARERAAVTTARRGEREFARAGASEEFEAFKARDGQNVLGSETLGTVDQAMTEGVLPATFDLLSMGNFAAAGGVDEYLRTGSTWEAFKQVGIEMASALPGIELEGAKKKSFYETDLPEQMFGADVADGRWSGPAVGFLLDVVLDPLTWVPIAGPALKASKLGLLAGKTTGPIRGALRGGLETLGQTSPGQALSKIFIHEDRRLFKHLKDLKIYEKGADPEKVAKSIMDARDRMSNALEIADEAIFTNVRRLFAHLEPQERAVLGIIGADVKRTKEAINMMLEKGIITEERAGLVKKAMEGLHGKRVRGKGGKFAHAPGLLEKLWKSGRRTGFYDEDQLADFFFHGTKKGAEGESGKVLDKVFRERGMLKQGGAVGEEAKVGTVNLLEEAFDTEIDIAKIAYQRTLEYAKWSQSKKFIRAVASDSRISKRITEDLADGRPIWKDAAKWATHKKEFRKNVPGYDILEIKRPSHYGIGKTAVKGEAAEGVTTAAFIMPKQIVDAVKNANRIFTDPDEMAELMGVVGKWTSVWRGYATFSAGFHMRNALSMFFNNWLAGVGTHKAGAIAGRLDNPARMLKKHLQAFRLQVADQGSITSPPEWVAKALNVLGYNSIEAIPLPKVRWPKGSAKAGQVMTPTELVRHARRNGVMQVATKMDNTPSGFEKELLGIKSGKITRSKEAIELPEDVRKVIGGDVASDIIEQASVPTPGANIAKGASDFIREGGKSVSVGGKSYNGKLLEWNRAFGSFVENNGRLALWIDRVEKGSSFADARRATTMWHYDYRKLTRFERRWMRSLIPFYAWMRFNTPRMLQAIVKDPERFSRLPKLIRNVENMSEFKLSDAEEPDYLDEVVHAQLPAMRNGKPLFVTPDLPIGDIGNLNKKDIASSLHPLLKVFIEDIPAGGANFFTGAPLERFPGELDEETGLGRRALHNIGTIFPPIQKFLRGKRAWERDEFLEYMTSEFSGVRVKPIDVRRVTRGNKFHEEGIVRKFRQRIKQRVDLDKLEEKKKTESKPSAMDRLLEGQ